jgi:hypothetical protein
MVIQTEGRSISQHLPSHCKTINAEDMHRDIAFVLWSEGEDLIIQNQVELRGRKWRKVAEEFQRYFSWSQKRLTIKHRADWLACVN